MQYKSIHPDKMSITLEFFRALLGRRDKESLVEFVLDRTISILECDRATIFLKRSEKDLESYIATGVEKMKLIVPAEHSIAGYVARTGDIVNTDNAYSHPLFYKKIDKETGYKTRSILCLPLESIDGEIIGSLEVINKLGRRCFTEEDVELLSIMASFVTMAVQNVLIMEELRKRNIELREKVAKAHGEIVGVSRAMFRVLDLARSASQNDLSVIITGESGVGKELVAKFIHFNSKRADGPFIVMNCAAIPESILESELFGIEKGVATGVEKRVGKFEQANKGTLFMDEIVDMSLKAQAELLRVIEEKKFERVGGRQEIQVDIRFITATNKDIENEVKEGRFREDLFYRLNVIKIHIPALRERREDIPALVEHYLNMHCKSMGKNVRISDEALEYLLKYDWRGNVRELSNEIARCVAIAKGDMITPDILSERIRASILTVTGEQTKDIHEVRDRAEKEAIIQALTKVEGNRTRAAKILGITRQSLIKKLKLYGIG